MFNFWIQSNFQLGPLTIAWYAIFIMTGVIIAVWMGIKEGKKLGVSSDFIYLGVLIILPLSIIGARLWYVLFNPVDSFMEFIGFYNGKFEGLSGLAIHGGLMVAIITVFIYCKKRGVSLYKVIDFVAPGFFVGQILGRFGNFCNHELYGPIVENFEFLANIPILGDNMYINGAYRHPVFLYEAGLNLIGLSILLVLRRKWKNLKSGDLMGIYLTWYGMVRIFTETLRLNSGAGEAMQSENKLSISITVSVIFIVVGVVFLIAKRFIGPKDNYQDIISDVAKNKLDTLLFDLDGTLLDTKPLIDRSFIHTFEHFRPDMTITDEMLDSFFGPTLRQTFSKYSNDEEEINKMIAYYREYNIGHHNEIVKPFPGAKEIIRALHSKGYNIGVVSSKKRDVIKLGLDLAGITEYIDVVIGDEDVSNHKPAPDGILLAIEKLKNISSSYKEEFEKKIENDNILIKYYKKLTFVNKKEVNNVAYVGDTLNDMKAAKAANVKAIGVLYIKNPEIMLEANPDYVISKLSEMNSVCVE